MTICPCFHGIMGTTIRTVFYNKKMSEELKFDKFEQTIVLIPKVMNLNIDYKNPDQIHDEIQLFFLVDGKETLICSKKTNGNSFSMLIDTKNIPNKKYVFFIIKVYNTNGVLIDYFKSDELYKISKKSPKKIRKKETIKDFNE